MSVKTVTMSPYADEVRFLVRDEAADLSRAYSPYILTRSRKQKVLEATAKIVDMDAEQQGRLATPAEVKKNIRAACDLIDLLLIPGEDSPPAGAMLFKAWENDLTPEHAISEVLAKAMGLAEDPPDPT